MSIFVKSTPAPEAKSKEAKQISILFAGLLTIMAIAQLFTFDTFIELVPRFELPISETFAYALVPLIVVFEVFALPYLLRMRLSIAFRWVSMVCGWLAALTWLLISWWVVAKGVAVETVGFMGTLVHLNPGWWAVLIAVSFCILAAWCAWGLWPSRKTVK